MREVQTSLKTDIGLLYLTATNNGLRGITWEPTQAPMVKLDKSDDFPTQILKTACHQIEEYFSGRRKSFDIPLDLEGTGFQKKVWRQLEQIPYGSTVSYQWVAHQIQNQKAVRAVGQANGKNPVPIVVPCHRVISANGELGGYSGGVDIKTKLLEIERIH